MHKRYNCAVVTIVAAAGHDSSHGLPGVSRPRIPQLCMRLNSFEDRPSYVAMLDDPKNEVLTSHWSTRAWMYQEGIMSSRRLVFTPFQAIFQCQSATGMESGLFDNDPATLGIRLGPFEPLRVPKSLLNISLLTNHIDRYSRSDLTYQSDALNGFKGLLALAKDNWGIPTFWGIPFSSIEDFAIGLTFSNHYGHYTRRSGFPSWSWTGWIGQVNFNGTHAEGPARDLRVSLQNLDGSYTKSDMTFVPGVTVELDRVPPVYTTKLRLVALAFTLQPEEVSIFQQPPHFQTVRIGIRKIVDFDSSHPVSWSVYINARNLHALKMVQAPLQILLIHQSIGLVVQNCAGGTERAGVVELFSECERSLPCNEHVKQYLPDFYKCSLRTSYLT